MNTAHSTTLVLIRHTLLVLVLSLVSLAASAAEPVSKSRLSGVAIGGHDSVAYHSLDREPQKKCCERSQELYRGA